MGADDGAGGAVIRRRNGPKVVALFGAVTLSACGLIVVARHEYRGAHDNREGLTIRPLASSSAPPSAAATATERAVELAFLATQQDPGNVDAWLTLGAAYERMGKKQEALESYRSCARKAISHPRVSECKELAGTKD